MIIGTIGAVVGLVIRVRTHPNAQKVWLADVQLGVGHDVVQIVFGGFSKLSQGDLVPVALPGTRVKVLGRDKLKKMRNRSYRDERSHGMLCSLRELGWVEACVDEVAVLRGLRPGQSLDAIPVPDRAAHVKNWSFAEV